MIIWPFFLGEVNKNKNIVFLLALKKQSSSIRQSIVMRRPIIAHGIIT